MIELFAQFRETAAELAEVHHPLLFLAPLAAQRHPHAEGMPVQIAVFAAGWMLRVVQRMRRLEIKLPENLETRHVYFTPMILCVCNDRRQRGWRRQ